MFASRYTRPAEDQFCHLWLLGSTSRYAKAQGIDAGFPDQTQWQRFCSPSTRRHATSSIIATARQGKNDHCVTTQICTLAYLVPEKSPCNSTNRWKKEEFTRKLAAYAFKFTWKHHDSWWFFMSFPSQKFQICGSTEHNFQNPMGPILQFNMETSWPRYESTVKMDSCRKN